MMASQPKIFRRQRGAGLFTTLTGTGPLLGILKREVKKRKQRGAGLLSIFTRPLPRLFGKKVTKQAAKAVAKRVVKKAAEKAATGAVTAGASWATQKALDRI